jgi:phosphoribosylformylglycinamidine cyclo-ligase
MIQQAGEVPDHEMYRVFNMGIGFVLVVDPEGAEPVMRLDGAHLIGTLRAGTGDTRTELIGFEHPA